FALVQDFKRLEVVTSPITHFTGDVDIRKEIHLNLDGAIALTGLTAPTLDVKAKASSLVPTHLCFLVLRKKVTDVVEHTSVRSRVGPRSPPNWRLINLDEFVKVFYAFDTHRTAWNLTCTIELIRQSLRQDLNDHRGFAGTGDPSHAH